MQAITKKQQEVLEFIKGYIRTQGMAPTLYEIADGMDFKSPNAAANHVTALEKKGAISVRRGVSRGITVMNELRTPLSIPDTADSSYWFDGVFQHMRYERDVYKSIKMAGLEVAGKSWKGE